MNFKNLANYVPLGIALMFVAFLLYGTYRRTEEFTTMRGDFPPFVEMQRNIRAVMDKYYTYDLSKFSSITQQALYEVAGRQLNGMGGSFKDGFNFVEEGILKSNFIPILTDPSRMSKVQSENPEGAALINEYKAFLPSGFTLNMDSLPIDTHMAILHAGRDFLSSKIRSFKQGDKFPVEQMILASLALDGFTRVFKNALIGGYFALTLQTSGAKPK